MGQDGPCYDKEKEVFYGGQTSNEGSQSEDKTDANTVIEEEKSSL